MRTTRRSASTRELPGQIALSADFIYVRGFKQLSTLDYNPLVPRSERTGARQTSTACPELPLRSCSTRRSARRGIAGSPCRRRAGSSTGTSSWRATRCRRPKTTRPTSRASSSRRTAAAAAIRTTSTGCPWRSIRTPKRALGAGSAAPLRRERHLRAAEAIELSSIMTIGSGRPYNILAGVDLNGDGDGGATDRARATLADITTSVSAKRGTLPRRPLSISGWRADFRSDGINIDGDLRGVQPLQPFELHRR